MFLLNRYTSVLNLDFSLKDKGPGGSLGQGGEGGRPGRKLFLCLYERKEHAQNLSAEPLLFIATGALTKLYAAPRRGDELMMKWRIATRQKGTPTHGEVTVRMLDSDRDMWIQGVSRVYS